MATLNLTQTRVSGELLIDTLNLEQLTAEGLRVSGPTFISQISVKTDADLSDTTFSALSWADIDVPQQENGVHIAGMSFQGIKGSLDGLRTLVKSASYEAAAYGQLESEAQRRGNVEAFNQMLDDQKSRERKQLRWWFPGEGVRAVYSIVSWPLTNYGHNPERSIAWGIVIVLVGGLVFRRRFMEPAPVKAEDGEVLTAAAGNEPYNSFVYSLGLFIPGIHLDMARRWKPKGGAVFWLRVLHEFLGWLFTGLAIASFSGLLPRV